MKDYKYAWGSIPEHGTCEECRYDFKYSLKSKIIPKVCFEHRKSMKIQKHMIGEIIEFTCMHPSKHTFLDAYNIGTHTKYCPRHEPQIGTKVGSELHLTCEYQANPHPFIHIYKRSVVPKYCPTHRLLIIENLILRDESKRVKKSLERVFQNDLTIDGSEKPLSSEHIRSTTQRNMNNVCIHVTKELLDGILVTQEQQAVINSQKEPCKRKHKAGDIITSLCRSPKEKSLFENHLFVYTYTQGTFLKWCLEHRGIIRIYRYEISKKDREKNYKKPGPLTEDEISYYQSFRDEIKNVVESTESTFDSKKRHVRREGGANARRFR